MSTVSEEAHKAAIPIQKTLAHIRIAHAGLAPCGGGEALSLFAADELLQSGITPHALLEAQGFDPGALARKYNPDQPRVPAGNGRASGQWTSDGAGISDGVVEGRSTAIDGSNADDSVTAASNEKDKSYEERRARGEESPKDDAGEAMLSLNVSAGVRYLLKVDGYWTDSETALASFSRMPNRNQNVPDQISDTLGANYGSKRDLEAKLRTSTSE